jgi:hypothetical protein
MQHPLAKAGTRWQWAATLLSAGFSPDACTAEDKLVDQATAVTDHSSKNAVEAVLRENARLQPEFADARRAGILAAYEDSRMAADAMFYVLDLLDEYEELTTRGTHPARVAEEFISLKSEGSPARVALETYKRSRAPAKLLSRTKKVWW